MKKFSKVLIVVMLVALTCMTSVTAFASEESTGVTPRLSHMEDGAFTFSATADGGYIDVVYYGYDSFVRADLTVRVEKNYLWFFWSEIGTWSDSSTEMNGDFYHVFTLTGSATYRATFTLLITGNDGTVDTVERVIESKY